MTVWGKLILEKREAKFEVRRLAFWADFSGKISSISEDYGAFNARTTRPLINAGYPDRWILDSSHIHRWTSCVFSALDPHLL